MTPEKSYSQISKIRYFIETYLQLEGENKQTYHSSKIKESELISRLVAKGSFSYEDCRLYINKAIENGQIFERDRILEKI